MTNIVARWCTIKQQHCVQTNDKHLQSTLAFLLHFIHRTRHTTRPDTLTTISINNSRHQQTKLQLFAIQVVTLTVYSSHLSIHPYSASQAAQLAVVIPARLSSSHLSIFLRKNKITPKLTSSVLWRWTFWFGKCQQQ